MRLVEKELRPFFGVRIEDHFAAQHLKQKILRRQVALMELQRLSIPREPSHRHLVPLLAKESGRLRAGQQDEGVVVESIVRSVVRHVDHQAEVVQLFRHLLEVRSLEVRRHASQVEICDLVLDYQSRCDF